MNCSLGGRYSFFSVVERFENVGSEMFLGGGEDGKEVCGFMMIMSRSIYSGAVAVLRMGNVLCVSERSLD